MHRLAPGDYQLPFAHATVANVRRAVRHVLKESGKKNIAIRLVSVILLTSLLNLCLLIILLYIFLTLISNNN